MPVLDTSPNRVSACPVHFLWDGKGLGRPLVRSSFMAFAAAGGLATIGWMLRHDDVLLSACVVAGVGGVAWCAGQVASLLVGRAARTAVR